MGKGRQAKKFLELQHKASCRDVVTSPRSLNDVGTDKVRSHTDPPVFLAPAHDGSGVHQRHAMAAWLSADGEGIVHDEASPLGVDLIRSTDVAVSGE